MSVEKVGINPKGSIHAESGEPRKWTVVQRNVIRVPPLQEGKWTTAGLLGVGGFARVYAADWNGTRVAVKIFPESVVPGVCRLAFLSLTSCSNVFDLRQVLQDEFNVWSTLRHPNILEFFGACSFAHPPFFVCALKKNGSLMDYLRRCPDANRAKLVRGIRQIMQ